MVSIVSAAPIPHSPPIAKPNAARSTSSATRVGANAEASSSTENNMMSTMSTGRRP